jgi:hypothetical protein
LPCGRCIGCRTRRQQTWALRILHESQMHDTNSFVTLTYDDEHFKPSLDYGDFQKFMRAARAKWGPTRFFAVGEYGEQTDRPHFHAILFGRGFQGTPIGKDICRSQELEQLWTQGMSSYGQVTYQSAAYVAGYCTKKRLGAAAKEEQTGIDPRTGEIFVKVPEMAHMSLKPGIGTTWFEKYWKEVYLSRDGCVLKGGRMIPAPKFYDRLLETKNIELKEEKELERYFKSREFYRDQSRERLKVRETVAIARIRQKERRL